MNQRIQQLAEQAGFMEAWFSESGDDCEREIKKFAELIVRECADSGQRYADGNYEVPNRILEHFGVEE